MAPIGSVVTTLELESAAFVRDLNKASNALNRAAGQMQAQTAVMARGFNLASNAVKSFAAGFGVAFGAAGIAQIGRMGKAALDAAGNLGEFAAQAGVATSELQKLTFAGVQVGVSQQQLINLMGQFGRRVGEAAQGTGQLKDTFERYGIAVKNSEGHVRSSMEVLGDLAEAVKNAGSAQEQLSIVSDAFGSRLGGQILPLLQEGREGLERWGEAAERAGLVLDAQFIAKADKAADSLASLQYAISTGFQVGFVEAFAGEVEITEEHIREVAAAAEEVGRIVGRVFQFMIEAAAEFNKRLETTKKEWALIQDAMAAIGIETRSVDVQIADLNEQLAGLIAKRRELSEVAEAKGIAPATTFAVQEANKQIEATRKARDALLGQRDAAQALAAANKPLEVTITKAAESTDELAVAADGAAKRTSELGKALALLAHREAADATAALEEFNKQAALVETIEPTGLGDEELRRRMGQLESGRRIAKEQDTPAEFVRQHKEAADEVDQLWENATKSIQSTLADTFTEIFDGGVTSFKEFATEIRGIFTRLAGELAAMQIMRTAMGGGVGGFNFLGLAGAGGAPGGFPAGIGPQGPTGMTGVPLAGGPSTFLGMGAFGAGLAGVGVGTVAGSAIGGNQTGAMVGSTIGAFAARASTEPSGFPRRPSSCARCSISESGSDRATDLLPHLGSAPMLDRQPVWLGVPAAVLREGYDALAHGVQPLDSSAAARRAVRRRRISCAAALSGQTPSQTPSIV